MIIPCKRPKVVVGKESLLSWYTRCHVTGCDWLYGMTSSKTDAEENARRHRAAHRNAVPRTYDAPVDGRPATRCACGWTTGPGVTTRADRERATEYHLSADHKLVRA